VIVFGYPPDKYSVTVEYFKSLGAATEPEPNTEIVNCFRIGFRDPGEAARVVRRNGEVLGGTWMVGVKWAVCRSSFLLLGCFDPNCLFFFLGLGGGGRPRIVTACIRVCNFDAVSRHTVVCNGHR
jgi:hypothetical protein